MTPSRRTLIVLGSLLAAMTIASALLLILQPAPAVPFSHIRLLSTDRATSPVEQLFQTINPVQSGRWKSVTVRLSGNTYGSAQTVTSQHELLGLRGLGYHFVMGNGSASPDGQIEVGFRWQHQMESAMPLGTPADSPDHIQICLIGSARDGGSTPRQVQELVWLLRNLQLRLGISADKISFVQVGPFAVGAAFPEMLIRQQLFQTQ
ncbi:MAG: hypothetical protein IT443_02065 [Phycisphaeraceae bacterium]|nr:hypothetical protein [Phycisphaeraceae bacterium]